MWIVHRIEGKCALCETDGREMRPVPLKDLPAGISEGDVLQKGAEGFWIDREETAKRRTGNAAKIKRLRKG